MTALKALLLDQPTLYRLYVEEQKSTPEIAELFGVRHKTICRRLKAWGIKARSLSEAARVAYAHHRQVPTHIEKVLKTQAREISILQKRVTLLEAENILLRGNEQGRRDNGASQSGKGIRNNASN